MMTAVAQVAPLVRTGLLGGIAVAVLLYPVASLAGLAVKSGAEAVDSLPRRLPIALEKRMSKTQILEGYLKVAYFGHRAYGIFAASNVYFSKPPDQLTLDEAAMVAGLVQAPSDYDPAGPDRSAALDRRNYVIDRMAALGDISPPQAAAAK